MTFPARVKIWIVNNMKILMGKDELVHYRKGILFRTINADQVHRLKRGWNMEAKNV